MSAQNEYTPSSMLPRHLRGRVSSRTLVEGRWVRSETEQARLAIFGRDEVNRVNLRSHSERMAATAKAWGALLA